MISTRMAPWADPFVLTAACGTPGERAALQQRVRRGDLVTVRRGVHLSRQTWDGLDATARHLALVRACALVAREELTFSHASAALLWDLPMVEPWPDRAHVTDGPRRIRSGTYLFRHHDSRAVNSVVIDALLVTDLARTVVDLARTLPYPAAVAVADAALRRQQHPVAPLPASHVTEESLQAELSLLPKSHGSVRAAKVISFADGRAQLPGESLSRVNIALAALPAPVLQQELYGRSGRRYVVDFWWPEHRLIGEFDGAAKYSDPVFLSGRTPQRALLDEKHREDDLRAAGHGFSRWGWRIAISPHRLRWHLADAGLR